MYTCVNVLEDLIKWLRGREPRTCFQNIVQSENFFHIWYISPIPVEHWQKKWEKNIWNSLLVTKCSYQ